MYTCIWYNNIYRVEFLKGNNWYRMDVTTILLNVMLVHRMLLSDNGLHWYRMHVTTILPNIMLIHCMLLSDNGLSCVLYVLCDQPDEHLLIPLSRHDTQQHFQPATFSAQRCYTQRSTRKILIDIHNEPSIHQMAKRKGIAN